MDRKLKAVIGLCGSFLCGAREGLAQAPAPISDEIIEARVKQAGALFGYMSGVGGGPAGVLAAPVVERVFAATAKEAQSINRLGQCADAQCLSAEFQRREAAMLNHGREKSLRPQRDASLEALGAAARRPWGSAIESRLLNWVNNSAIADRLLDAVEHLTEQASLAMRGGSEPSIDRSSKWTAVEMSFAMYGQQGTQPMPRSCSVTFSAKAGDMSPFFAAVTDQSQQTCRVESSDTQSRDQQTATLFCSANRPADGGSPLQSLGGGPGQSLPWQRLRMSAVRQSSQSVIMTTKVFVDRGYFGEYTVKFAPCD